MGKGKVPATSGAAYEAVTYEMLTGHYKKIVDALKSLGTANYEAISAFCFLDRHQVGRRLKELEEEMKMVYKPGTTSPTKSGRQAYNYCLTGSGMPKTDKEVRYSKGTMNASDHAGQLLTLSKQWKQKEMF